MASHFGVSRVLGNGSHNPHHNNKWGVYKRAGHSSTGKAIFVAAGDMAKGRAEYVCRMFQSARSGEDERFMQALLAGDKTADSRLREIVGAKPRVRA